MRAARQFIAVVIATLLIAAAVLLPGREEHAAMLAGEGRHREAIALLERQLVDAPGDPNLLAALSRSFAALGENERAIHAFDAYLAIRPDDLAARAKQAELLLQAGVTDRYVDTVAQLVAAQPGRENVRRLVELYRLHGRFDDELAALRTYAGRALLEPHQLERLGAMVAQLGQWLEARHWLELADQDAPRNAHAGRFLLLEVLIHLHDNDAAYRHALAWMTAWRRPFLTGQLIAKMAQAGLTDEAVRLARGHVDMAPEDTFALVDLLASKGQPVLAQQMLAQWASRAEKPAEQDMRAFVRASAMLGDNRAPLLKMMQLTRIGADPVTRAVLAEQIADQFGMSSMAAVRPLLSDDVLRARPLFAARLALFEGNRELARRYLAMVEPDQLSPGRSAAWLALLRRVETDAGIVAQLAALWNEGRLPADLVSPFADQALKLRMVRLHDRIWSSMQR